VGRFLAAHAEGNWAAMAAQYHAPLLDGFILSNAAEFDEWATAERARLEGLAREAIERAARESDASDTAAAIKRWRQLVAIDPLSTPYALGYAAALRRGADPGSALRHLQEHRRRLHADLGLVAPAELQAAVEELTRQQEPAAAGSRPAASAAPSAPRPLASAAGEPSAVPAARARSRLPALGVAAALFFAAWYWWAHRPVRTLDRGAMVVLTDVENLTGDSTLSRPLRVAAEVGLRQSSSFSLYPRSAIGLSLRRMGRTIADTVLDEALAREIALRESGRAVVITQLASVGSRYGLTFRIIDPATGRDLASRQDRVDGPEGLLDAVERLTTWTRRTLGDREWQSAARLPLVTTPSFAALTAFAEAGEAQNRGEWSVALTLLERAIELDTGFAMAQASLGDLQLRLNRVPDALRWLREAERRAARLTEPEQLVVETRLARAEGRIQDFLGLAGSFATRFPSAAGWLLYSEALRTSGASGEAAAAARRAIELDTASPFGYHDLALAEKAQGNYRQALDAYAEIDRRDSTWLQSTFLNQQWGEAFVMVGAFDSAAAVFRRMLRLPSPQDRARGHRALAYLAMYRGQYALASEEIRQSIRLQTRGSLSEYRDVVLLADLSRTQGDRTTAAAALDRAYEIAKASQLEAAALMFAGHQSVLSGELARARGYVAAAAKMAALRPNSRQDQESLAILEGDVALADGRYQAARDALSRGDFTVYPVLGRLLRAEAFFGLGQLDSALVLARAANASPEFGLEVQGDWLRSFGTVARIAEAAREPAAARETWSALVELWREADPTLPPLLEARAELARLQTTTAR
ncbi:MAG: hypothetical protein AB7S39_19000, partial [Gemmatimonadales bacterium]